MNKGFDEAWLEQLKSKNEIVSTISRYLPLQKKGKNYWACCPFHHEKTPSFCINEYEQYYHCFGCKEHGNVITFIMKIESCDYLSAIERLAKNANMEIPSFSIDNNVAKKKKNKETVLKILDLAAKHYEQNLYLKTSKLAQEYVKKRKFTKKELDKFHIGYAKNWHDMVDYLKSQNFSIENMKDAGIVESKNNNIYDVMGERLIFPIYNLYDECIGFSARSLVPTNYAKYKNTANTIVFDKSKNLFGINLVKKLKQQKGLDYIIIVEGQMDVVALHQAGFENCVACLGTALTPFHTRLLKNLCDNIIVSLDGDFAGQKATIKTIDTLSNGGMNVRAIKIPNNMDPDEFIKAEGKEAYQKLLDNAINYIEFKIRNKMEQFDLMKIDEKAKFVKEALNIVNELNTNSEKQVYLEVIKNLTNISTDVLQHDLDNSLDKVVKQETKTEINYTEDAEIKAIKFILASLCYKKEYANFDFDLEKYLINPTYIKLYKMLKEYHMKNEEFRISILFDTFDVENEPNLKDIIDYNFNFVKNNSEYYNECIWKIRENYLKNLIKQLSGKFNDAVDNQQKLKIAEEINLTQKKLRNKVLED